jgi:hypothetical protein
MKTKFAGLFILSLMAISGAAHATGTTPNDLYRIADLRTGDHLFTISFDEMINAVQGGGKYEGVAARCFDSQQPGTVPLYRLFAPSTVDHFYTTDEREAEIATVGGVYRREGIACYVYPASQQGACEIFRLSFPGHHFYTQSWSEVLADIGTGSRYEGVQAYAPPAGTSCPQ